MLVLWHRRGAQARDARGCRCRAARRRWGTMASVDVVDAAHFPAAKHAGKPDQALLGTKSSNYAFKMGLGALYTYTTRC